MFSTIILKAREKLHGIFICGAEFYAVKSRQSAKLKNQNPLLSCFFFSPVSEVAYIIEENQKIPLKCREKWGIIVLKLRHRERKSYYE